MLSLRNCGQSKNLFLHMMHTVKLVRERERKCDLLEVDLGFHRFPTKAAKCTCRWLEGV